MILDAQNIFCEGQAVTSADVTSDVVDLGLGDAGPSERISVFVNAWPVFGGTGTIEVELQTSASITESTKALASPVTTLAKFPLTNDQLKKGGKLVAARLPHNCQQYVGLKFVVSDSAALTGGLITAGLALDVAS